MQHPAMTWQSIASRDPYLAGSIAAREHEWWEEITPEQEADSVGLTGNQRFLFLSGWDEEVAEAEQERQERITQEREGMADGYNKGDPAAR